MLPDDAIVIGANRPINTTVISRTNKDLNLAFIFEGNVRALDE